MVSSYVPLEGKSVTVVVGHTPRPPRRALRLAERVLVPVLAIGLVYLWCRLWGWGQVVPGLIFGVVAVGLMSLVYRHGTARRRRLAALDPDTFWFGVARSWPKPGLDSFTKPTHRGCSQGRLILDVHGISFEDSSFRSWRVHWSEIIGLEVFKDDRSVEAMAVTATEGRGALLQFDADPRFRAALRQLGADIRLAHDELTGPPVPAP